MRLDAQLYGTISETLITRHTGVYPHEVPGFGHENVQNVGATTPSAWIGFTCGHCSHKVSGAIVAGVIKTGDVVGPAGPYLPAWFRCANCGEPSCLDTRKAVHPGPAAGVTVGGLPTDVEDAYEEARRCMTVNAYTACELLCRKLLMHVAADKAGATSGESFAAYITKLEAAGYITPPMKAWVDLIRKHANEATHELPATSRERAEGTLMFTAELLRIVYEMEHLARQYSPPAAVEANVAAAQDGGGGA